MSVLTEKQYDQLWAVCEGTATPEEVAAFEQWIHGSSEARREYVRYVALHVDLLWDDLAADPPAPPAVDHETTDVAVAPTIEVEPTALSRRHKRFDSIHWQLHKFRFSTMTAVLTALAWVGFSYFVWYSTTPDDSRPESDGVNVNFVARITGQYEHQWVESTRGIPPFAFLVPGEELNLVEGLIEITFFDGAVVVLEAPAEFVVDSRGAGTLEVGKLAATVPPEASGFMIDTPSARFVDLGTEFGVEVDVQGLSELHVTKGTVEATLISNRGHRITVSQGQAVRLDEERVGFARIPVNTGRFVTVVPLLLQPDALAENGFPVSADSQLTLTSEVLGPGSSDTLHSAVSFRYFTDSGQSVLPLVAGPVNGVTFQEFNWLTAESSPQALTNGGTVAVSGTIGTGQAREMNASTTISGTGELVLESVVATMSYLGSGDSMTITLAFGAANANKAINVQLFGGDLNWTSAATVEVNAASIGTWANIADGNKFTASMFLFDATTDSSGDLSIKITAIGNFVAIAGVITNPPEPSQADVNLEQEESEGE